MEKQSSEYLPTPEAARYLRVSRFFLEASRCRGDGPPFVKIGKSVRYRRGDLDEFMRSHRHTKTLEKRPAAKQVRLSIEGDACDASIQGGNDDQLG